MDQIFIFDRAKIGAELDRFVDHAQTLTAPKELSTAIQALGYHCVYPRCAGTSGAGESVAWADLSGVG